MRANAKVMESKGEAESTRLRAAGAVGSGLRLNGLGEAEAIRALGEAKASAYRAGVDALGVQSYTSIQLMQILGEQHVRVVPDILVSGNGQGSQLTDALLGMVLRDHCAGPGGTAGVDRRCVATQADRIVPGVEKALAEGLHHRFGFRMHVQLFVDVADVETHGVDADLDEFLAAVL